ncbi:DUF488 domain-containing protein [Candidatus Azambacteria bacterium]|nr:DUF488 domain-containing protein [Candidatus Azambacteria bacterium]
MPLWTRCIKEPKRDTDGVRISVMSRHTLDDGVTPDPEITPDMFDEWRKELGPPPKLIGPYRRKEISWDEFAKKFRAYLLLPQGELLLRRLIKRARISSVTILCVEDAPKQCHRRLIAELCAEIDPSLEVYIE